MFFWSFAGIPFRSEGVSKSHQPYSGGVTLFRSCSLSLSPCFHQGTWQHPPHSSPIRRWPPGHLGMHYNWRMTWWLVIYLTGTNQHFTQNDTRGYIDMIFVACINVFLFYICAVVSTHVGTMLVKWVHLPPFWRWKCENQTRIKPTTYLYFCIYISDPNDPCFCWKRLCFEGLTFKFRGHWGSIYIYIYTYWDAPTIFFRLTKYRS